MKLLINFWQLRRAWFTRPTRRYFDSRTGVIPPEPGTGRGEWVLSRGWCRYRCFDLAGLPAARREESLQLKIQQWSPYTRTAEYVVWQGDCAQVWIWDEARAAQVREASGAAQAAPVPENLVRPPLADGVRLAACLDGVEGQIWQQRQLLASRWWLKPPDLLEWSRFLRAHGQPSPAHVLTPEPLPLLAKPWGKPRRRNTAANERAIALVAAMALAVVLGWESATLWKTHQKHQAIQQEIEKLNQDGAAILQARDHAVTDKERVRQLVRLVPYPSQLELMAAVAGKLPRNGAQLAEWRYHAGTLRVAVQAPNIDPRNYVAAFQSLPLFKGIKLETSNQADLIILQMEINPAQ